MAGFSDSVHFIFCFVAIVIRFYELSEVVKTILEKRRERSIYRREFNYFFFFELPSYVKYSYIQSIMSVPITASGLQGQQPLVKQKKVSKGSRQNRSVTSGKGLALRTLEKRRKKRGLKIKLQIYLLYLFDLVVNLFFVFLLCFYSVPVFAFILL